MKTLSGENRPSWARALFSLAAVLFVIGVAGIILRLISINPKDAVTMNLSSASLKDYQLNGDLYTSTSNDSWFLFNDVHQPVKTVTLHFSKSLGENTVIAVYFATEKSSFSEAQAITKIFLAGTTTAIIPVNQEITALRIDITAEKNQQFNLASIVLNEAIMTWADIEVFVIFAAFGLLLMITPVLYNLVVTKRKFINTLAEFLIMGVTTFIIIYQLLPLKDSAIKSTPYITIRYVLFILLIAIILISFCLLFAKKIKHQSQIMFLCSLSVIFLTFSIKYYFLVINPEPYAEEATNYLRNAFNLGFFENLSVPDAGYLPLPQHILAWICVRILHMGSNSIFTLNLVALLSISAICAMINSRHLDQYFSVKTRFFVSLLLPLFVMESFDALVFINFTYFGIILAVFALLVDLNALSKKFFISLTIIIALCCLSKGFYIVLIPISLLIIIIKNKKLSVRELIITVSILISSSIQLIYSFKYQQMWLKSDLSAGALASVVSIVKNTILIYCKVLIGMFGLRLELIKDYIIYIIGILFLTITFLLPLYLYFIKKVKNRKLIVLVILNFVVLTICAFCVLTLPYMIGFISLYKNRQEVFMIATMFFTFFVAVSKGRLYYFSSVLQEKKYLIGFVHGLCAVICFSILSNLLFTIPQKTSLSSVTDYSSWAEYSKYVNYDSYCIPILPNGWTYQKNDDIYCIGNRKSQLIGAKIIKPSFQDEKQDKIDIFRYTELSGKKIIGIYLNRNSIDNVKYKILLKDSQGSTLIETVQVNPEYKLFVGFLLEKPLSGVNSIEIYDIFSKPVYVDSQFYVIVKN